MATMTITAADVNKLRKTTGSGMMDCKKALVEAEGDFDKAVDILRKKGQKVAAKRADRDAAEGYVLAATNADATKAFLLALNCETDFVAKNQDFIDFATKISNIAIENNCSTAEDLNGQSFDEGMSVAEKITEQTGVIGEKIEIGCFEVITDARVVAYNHPGNQIASIVALTKSDVNDVDSIGKDVAMQIAAMNPVALNRDGVSSEVVEREIEIGKDQARQEGKPEEMLEKIATGKLNKFYKENTLLEQAFIKDNKMSIEKYLQSADKELTVSNFKRYSLSN